MVVTPMKSIVVTVGEADGAHYPVFVDDWDHQAGRCGERLGEGKLSHGWWDELQQDHPIQTSGQWVEHAPSIADGLGTLLGGCEEVGKLLFTCSDCRPDGYEMHPHLRVYFSTPPELSSVPWELVRIQERFVFRERGHLCLRGVPLATAQPPADGANLVADRLPIDVLIVVGDLDEYDTLRAEREIEAVFQLVNQYPAAWNVRVLEQPVWKRVKQELARKTPDILHIVGHSAVQGGQRALVVNADEEWQLGPGEINRLLLDKWPRLLLLNTCGSADMIPSLMQANAAGTVIGMQGQIDGDAAAQFAATFYTELIRQADVSLAVERARAELRALRELDDSAWALPVVALGRGAARDQVRAGLDELNQRYSLLMLQEPPPSRNPPFDRVAEERALHEGGRLTGLIGPQNAGKTFLVKRFLTSCRLNNDLVVYHSFSDGSDQRVDQRLGLAQAARAAAGQLVAQSCDAEQAKGLGALADDLEDLEAEPLAMTEVVGRLVNVLDGIALAAGRPLVMALDGVDRLSGYSGENAYTFVRAVLEHELQRPADRSAATPSRLIVVADEIPDDAEAGAPGIALWKGRRGVSVVELGHYDPAEYSVIGREVGARYGLGHGEVEDFVSVMPKRQGLFYPADLIALIGWLHPRLKQTGS